MGTSHYFLEIAKQHAKDVLQLAHIGGMPDTYWATDARIQRACKTLTWTTEEAQRWASKREYE